VRKERIEAQFLARSPSAIERDALLSIADFSLRGLSARPRDLHLWLGLAAWALPSTLPDPVTLSGFAGGLCESRSEGTSHAPGLGRDQPRTSSRYCLHKTPSLLLVFVLGHRQPPSHQHRERQVPLPPDRSRSKVEDGRHVTGQHRERTDGHDRPFRLAGSLLPLSICVCGHVRVRMDHRETDYGGQRSTPKRRN
jgi:hypothetical protein